MTRILIISIFILHCFMGFTTMAQHANWGATPKATKKVQLGPSTQEHYQQQNLYYDAGALKETRTLQHGRLDGEWIRYYENGQVQKKGIFKDDEPHGTWKSYSTSGVLTYIENYNTGKEHGEWKSFHPNGSLQVSGHFVQGKRQGKWYIYTAEGELENVLSFKDDIKVSM